jgi:uncharacterized protein YebE (UPF0316 family)
LRGSDFAKEAFVAEWLDLYPWMLPAVIFTGRICDVSLGTLRIIFVSRGERRLAPLIGFLEVFIWIMIISQLLSRANELSSYVAYAGGYASGTFIGMLLEARLGLGFTKYRLFTKKKGEELVNVLHAKGFGATLVHGEGAISHHVDIVETVISRKDAKNLELAIMAFDPSAFCVIEDIRAKQKGIFLKRK